MGRYPVCLALLALESALVADAPAEAAAPRRAGLDWWSLQPVGGPTPPAVANRGWVRNPIDAFVLARLEAAGLRPAPPADRATLVRRLTLDLLGLPPTPAEVDAFVADDRPDAYERLVERLLASPHYGERWGRHWLDVARFGESQGYERDKIRDHAWRYRDYVIRSFNADKPFDRFVREQLAGDVLAPRDPEGIVATGFLVAGPWDEVGNEQQGQLMKRRVREDELEDIVSAVGQGFLGLTVNCARCHDHKFDPIPQADYYRLKAAFEGVRHGNRPLLPPAAAQVWNDKAARLTARVRELEGAVASAEKTRKHVPAGLAAELARRRAEWAALGAVPLAYAANPSPPGPTFRLTRGDVEKPREQVAAGGLSAVRTPPPDFGLPFDAPEGQRRARLADWAASPDNPLTARVLVNRVWHYHFGEGLVRTPSDFGFNGDRPTHPELLDWLARAFLDGGWSIKRLHWLIVLSSTYRQASAAGRPVLAAFPARRLEGEAVRDAMLYASGRLSRRMGGPGFRPFITTVFNSNFYTLTDPEGPEYERRTVYRILVNSAKDPLLEAFDCPDPSVKSPRRTATTTPLQALDLMNDRFVVRQAAAFARRVRADAGPDPAAEAAWAYRLALGRRPAPDEAARADRLVREHGLETLCWVLFNSSEFLYLR